MTILFANRRLSAIRIAAILSFAMTFFLLPPPAVAAEANVLIKLRPHCEVANCPDFPLYDSETFITNGLNVGDTLDIDIVLQNPTGQSLQSVQSWVKYDSKILKGLEVKISDRFPLVAPGESGFAPESGVVKIGASNVSGGMRESEIAFARITFQVLKEMTDISSLVSFHEFSLLGQEGKTKVLVIEEGRTVNVLKTRPRELRLYFGENPPPSVIPPSTNPPVIPPVTNPPVNPPTNPPTIPPITPPLTDPTFAVLRPQGLRVMTKDDQVFLIWNALLDPRVVGYNIYYGTVSGRYIQRRTISSETTGVTIRNLPPGTRMYFALTAFNAGAQDSEYSDEVAVTVGDPASSTAPFTLAENGNVKPGNGGVPVGTGMPLTAIIVLAVIALLAGFGSFFFRRRILRNV